jgi:hypothetical protein
MGRWGLAGLLGIAALEERKENVMRAVVRRAGARRAWRSVLLTGCLVLGVLGPGAVDAQAATPSSLAGETFTSQHVNGSTLTGACNDEGGSFSFSVSGTAAGPFPGTFTESGGFTALRDGFLTNFSSTFTITSTSGAVTVTGTKSLVGDFSQVNCDDGFLSTNNDFTTVYSAAINGTGGGRGAATVNISGLVGLGSPIFSESFGSTGGVQKQCKHGGWKSFGTLFKNQGDCVSFFATGGKNPPSGR